MRVVLTRPAPDAGRWQQDLRLRGHEVLRLPLIEIGDAPQPAALAQARASLDRFQAAMFVSANAVQQFLRDGQPWPSPARAWATGPGTVRALQAAGVPAGLIDAPPADAAQFDSEALWTEVAVRVQPGWDVLLVRGAGNDGSPAGRDWLARRLDAAGARVTTVAAYTRRLPKWSGADRHAAAGAARDGSVWLFSSSEAIANLQSLLPGQGWDAARAVATHERIAQAAREAGFGVVCPSRPEPAAVVAALESLG
ncbi:MAG TPA: uroporphyrinogen-III synthase [Ramlibacter sp.]|jgi:uroporphyrinogen-III synthase|uniref:uroporphyrinogen-III synthase n=1 Tax=Ramlibacter sp. TaxID=1917967 RepID=UPI002D5C32E7|nr:uroporphyrinogen-III synthase [Ramlibacter sp.]HZY20298.1 uroporphyrinogen-III synthase [Ramlibacter sp.]